MKRNYQNRSAAARAFAGPRVSARQYNLPVSFPARTVPGSTALAFDRELAQREQRGLGLAALGLVNRLGDHFVVAASIVRDQAANSEVWLEATGAARCSCREFAARSLTELTFRCEHILAVKQSGLMETSMRRSTPATGGLNQRPGAVTPANSEPKSGGPTGLRRYFAGDPYAQSMSDLVTSRQLGFIRLLAREAGVDAEMECRDVMNCFSTDLARSAASAFIEYLKALPRHTGESNLRLAS
ncbi:MAG: SWIM zinc finger family protein [Pyrinomonadaceae bacterium]